MITSTTMHATTMDSGMAAPAFAAIGIGRNRIAAAGVITASEVITAWRTLSTPGRRRSPESCALESAAGAVMSSPSPEWAHCRAQASLGTPSARILVPRQIAFAPGGARLSDPRVASDCLSGGGPRRARGPWGGTVMVAPPWVTPGLSGTGQVPSGSAVRDGYRQRAAGSWAARGGTAGDVRGTSKVAVPGETARPAGEDPAGGLGYPAAAGGAGGGRAPLVHQHPPDPGLGGLVG